MSNIYKANGMILSKNNIILFIQTKTFHTIAFQTRHSQNLCLTFTTLLNRNKNKSIWYWRVKASKFIKYELNSDNVFVVLIAPSETDTREVILDALAKKAFIYLCNLNSFNHFLPDPSLYVIKMNKKRLTIVKQKV